MDIQRIFSRLLRAASCGLMLSACSPRADEGANHAGATRDTVPSDSIRRDSVRSDTVQRSGAAIQLERNRHEAAMVNEPHHQLELTIPMTFINRTADTVYLLGCGHPTMPLLEKRVDTGWAVVYAAVELECLSPPWRIPSGGTYRDTIIIHGQLAGRYAGPTFDAEVDGTYRLIRGAYADPAGKRPLPDSLRTSDAFEIVRRR